MYEFITLGDELLIFVLDELAFGSDGFFVLGLGLVVSHVVAEDADEEGHVNDGEEDPEDKSLVKEKVRHDDLFC